MGDCYFFPADHVSTPNPKSIKIIVIHHEVGYREVQESGAKYMTIVSLTDMMPLSFQQYMNTV